MRSPTIMAFAVLASAPGIAQAPAAPPAIYGPPIAMDDALVLLERGRKLAERCGFSMAFAVVEPSGELVAFVRMDGIPYASTPPRAAESPHFGPLPDDDGAVRRACPDRTCSADVIG